MDNKIHISINDLNKRQTEIFKSVINTPASETKYHIIRASRQSGKSFLIIRLAIYFAFSKPNQKGGLISASFVQFEKVFKDIIDICPPGLIHSSSKGINTIIFANGTSLQFFTAKNYNSIVGNTFDFLIGDEVALYPPGALEIITPTLAAKKEAKAVFASTPRGKNDFYTYCVKGMDTSQSFYKHYRMMYTDNEQYDLREVEEKRKIMPEAIFKTEYLGEFVFGKSSVFGDFAKYQLIKNWILYEGNQLYAGIDWAGDGEDSTMLTIMDAFGKILYMFEPESNNIPEQVNELSLVLKKYNYPITYSECNGLGLGATEMLQLKANNIYKFYMSNTSKNDVVSTFILNMNENGILLPTVDLFPKLDTEMVAFVVSRTANGSLTYAHSKGFHDDSVDSVLIANYARNKMANIGGVIFDTDDIAEELNSPILTNEDYNQKIYKEKNSYTSFVDSLYPDD